jgi:hypothetical protein
VFYDNPFLELYEGAPAAVEKILDCVKGVTIYPYEMKWRANPALEIGDKVTLTLEDNTNINIIYLGETIKYSGGLNSISEWKDTEKENITSTPTNLGEAIKQTYAKVDKVNKQIDIVAKESTANAEALAALTVNTEGISATVEQLKSNTETALEENSDLIAEISKKVEVAMDADSVDIAIESKMAEGINKVTTSTGFTFDDSGLTVSKSDSEMKTQITEDGMQVYKNDKEVLVANNEGVQATNLHATTYLIVGKNSRFEDYKNTNGEQRTGCFWIGD